MGKDFDPTDYSVVLKHRASPVLEMKIYRAGRLSPIQWSANYFSSMTTANKEGKVAHPTIGQAQCVSTAETPDPRTQLRSTVRLVVHTFQIR